jgi:Flp pilus assembly protein TadG
MRARAPAMWFSTVSRGRARALAACGDAGAAAVEFALFASLFVLLVAGTVDFGYLIYTTSELTAVVSAGSQYAVNNAILVNSTGGASLATSISQIVANANGTNWADSTVVVNNGPTMTLTGGSSSSGGTAANADHSYCPTGSPGNWTWGSEDPATCTSQGVAGRFVTITASHTVSPLFPTFGLAFNGAISRSAMVRTQ